MHEIAAKNYFALSIRNQLNADIRAICWKDVNGKLGNNRGKQAQVTAPRKITGRRDAAARAKARAVFSALRRMHPGAHIELRFRNPLELLVATILSAQCTDKRVNAITAGLFKKYRRPADYLRTGQSELEKDIRAAGCFRMKARSIRGAMAGILERHGGEVPRTMETLTALPGVGRKTANVILGNAYGIPGIVVDTHVIRVSNRLGLTRERDPVKIESDLAGLFHPRTWVLLSHTLVFHGRYVCKARAPLCEGCGARRMCPAFCKTGARAAN